LNLLHLEITSKLLQIWKTTRAHSKVSGTPDGSECS
jgi:hypothetical protein